MATFAGGKLKVNSKRRTNPDTKIDAENARERVGERIRYRITNKAVEPAQHSHRRNGHPPHDNAIDHLSVQIVGYDKKTGKSILQRLDGVEPKNIYTRLTSEENRAVELERAAVYHRTRRHDAEYAQYGINGKNHHSIDTVQEGRATLPIDYPKQEQIRRALINDYDKLAVAETREDGGEKMDYRKPSSKEIIQMRRRQQARFRDIWEIHDALPAEPPAQRNPPRNEEEKIGREIYICALHGKAERIREMLAAAEKKAEIQAAAMESEDSTGDLYCKTSTARNRAGLSAGKLLVQRLVNFRDQGNDTPLHAAVRSSSLDTVKLLLSMGADKHARNDNQMNACKVATKAGNLISVGSVQLAAQSGTNPDIVHALINEEELGLLLYKAAEHGNILEVKGLLEKGVFVDCTPHFSKRGKKSGWTPLHAAAHAGHLNIVDILCNAGANFLRKTKDGKTAEDLAKERRTDFGEDMNQLSASQDDDDHLNRHRPHVKCASRLRRAAEEALPVVNRNLRDACHDGDLKSAKRALQLGADVNVVVDSTSGMTPLHWAVKMDHLEIVRVLINHKNAQDEPMPADIRATDARGLTPLDYAKQGDAPNSFTLSGHDNENDPHVRLMGTYHMIGGGSVHNGGPIYKKEGAFVTLRMKSLVGGTEQTRTKKLSSGSYFAFQSKSKKWIITDDEATIQVDRGIIISSDPMNLPTDVLKGSPVGFKEILRAGAVQTVKPAIAVKSVNLSAFHGELDRPKRLGLVAENKIEKRTSNRSGIKKLLEAHDEKVAKVDATKAEKA